MRILDRTWEELSSAISERTVAVIPAGSVEQHGLHLPLGVDTYVASALAEKLADEPQALVLPPVTVGVSEYHRHFCGTLWATPESFKAYVEDILGSLKFHGLRRVLFVNGHGGNVNALQEICRFARMQDGIYGVVFTWFEAIAELLRETYGSPPPLHADEAETAIMMAIRPDLVREDRMRDSAAGAGRRWGQWQSGVMVSQEVADFSESGATGRPDEASEEKGRILLEASIRALRSLFSWLSGLPGEQLASRRKPWTHP
jgi:creatinine amidohydrolase